MDKKKRENGSIILETGIVLPIFMFIILFIYGLFSITSAQNKMTHALFQASKSLSMDPFLTERVESSAEEKTVFWGNLSDMILDISRLNNDPHFSSASDWYSASGDNNLAKKRFIGYFSGGDEAEAAKKLKDLKVINGLDGVNITMSINGDDMTLKMNYTIQIWFDAFDLGKIPVDQSVTVKLWKGNPK